ncbi:MAG: hypothetical protein IE921_08050 [Rhodobacteraceae bacterium]|nr:hypothetical protein [Paracoccaceae bacterium]
MFGLAAARVTREVFGRDRTGVSFAPTPPGNATIRYCLQKVPRRRISAACAGSGRGGGATNANERSEGNFCTMKITWEVWDFAAKQNSGVESFVAADLSTEGSAKVEAGIAEMSERFREVGSELYVGAGEREHD